MQALISYSGVGESLATCRRTWTI